jgi:hypothetical protein
MMPSWSQDGKALFVSSRNNGVLDLWRLPVEGGGSPVQITHNGGFDAVEFPERDAILFTKQHQPGFFWAKRDGTSEHGIAQLAGVECYRYWTASSKGIYFVSDGRISFFDFATEKTRDLGAITGKLTPAHPVWMCRQTGGICYSPGWMRLVGI